MVTHTSEPSAQNAGAEGRLTMDESHQIFKPKQTSLLASGVSL